MLARIVQLLLDAGADINACGHGASTELLRVPIATGNIGLLNILLDAGVDPNGVLHYSLVIPLVFASGRAKLQCAKLLIERGSDLEGVDSHLISEMYRYRNLKGPFSDAVEVVLKVKPNSNTGLLLVTAAKYEHGASVNLMPRHGTTPDTHTG